MSKRWLVDVLLGTVLIGALVLVEWATTPPAAEKTVHIETFRYGTSPAIIRANRGDRLRLTFSTRDAAHSFLLQDYHFEAKVSPASETVRIVDPFRPTVPLGDAREVRLTAGLPGWWGSLLSVSRFRCHVYCGPMHGFEQGDLVIRPNYLLWGSLGLLATIVTIGLCHALASPSERPAPEPPPWDINHRVPWIHRVLRWRPLQFVATLPTLAGFTLIVLTGLLGTKVGGRNFAVMMTWVVWMPLLAVVLVPVSTRLWCLVCPLPVLGEYLQRGPLTDVRLAAEGGRFAN